MQAISVFIYHLKQAQKGLALEYRNVFYENSLPFLFIPPLNILLVFDLPARPFHFHNKI